MMKKYLKIIGGFIFAAILIYFGFEYLLTNQQRSLFFSTSIRTHFISIVLALPVFIASGIGLRLLYKRLSETTLSIYDTLTLPIVMNLWGIIIPFQGAFIYTSSYIYSKYRKNITESFRVYLLSFSISISLAGFIGILFFYLTKIYVPNLFLLMSFLFFVNPGFLYLIGRFAGHFRSIDLAWLKKIAEWSQTAFSANQISGQFVLHLVVINLLTVVLTTIWSYWIVISLGLNLSITQLVLISLLMKLTLLVKVTPGNIGLNQMAASGIAVLVGGTAGDGFLLSVFQQLSMILIAFSVGTICTIVNLKHFRW